MCLTGVQHMEKVNQSKVHLLVPSSGMQDSPSLVHGTETDLCVLIVYMVQGICP